MYDDMTARSADRFPRPSHSSSCLKTSARFWAIRGRMWLMWVGDRVPQTPDQTWKVARQRRRIGDDSKCCNASEHWHTDCHGRV